MISKHLLLEVMITLLNGLTSKLLLSLNNMA